MKNKLFLFATFIFVSLGAFAANTTNATTTNNYYYNDGNSFTFVERGVTFSVFQNGEFDFYINPRSGFNARYQGNGVNISYNSGYNYDAYVQYDDYGAIIQVEDIPIYYDPMLSKLITYGKNRDEAIQLMIYAIDNYSIKGVETTLPFGRFVCEHEAFRSGHFDTHFVKNYYSPEALEAVRKEESEIAALIAVKQYLEDQKLLRLPII